MRIALLADLHGNLPATMAVDRDLRTRAVDAVYCLGDLVGKGPSSPETMDWAMAHCQVVIKGNWDIKISADGLGYPGRTWYGRQLGEERLRVLDALPLEHRFRMSGRNVRLLHGRPIAAEALDADAPLAQRAALFVTEDRYVPDMVGIADTHVPFYEHVTGVGILLNTGSVGNPLGGQPYASYGLLEGEMGADAGPLTYTVVQLDYDREEAARMAEAAEGLPAKEAYVREVLTGRYSR